MNWRRNATKVLFTALLSLTTNACHSKTGEKPVTFAHPQTVCLGRIRMTVPGPGASTYFIDSVMDGVGIKWEQLPNGKTFEQAWHERKQEIAKQDDILREYPPSANQVGAVSRFRDPFKPLKGGGAVNTIEVWKNLPPNLLILKFPGADPNFMPDVEASMAKVLNAFQPYATSPVAASEAFCTEGGTIHRISEYGEHIGGGIIIPLEEGLPNLTLSIITGVVNNTVSDGLLSRIDKAAPELRSAGARTRVLRHGPRTVAKMSGHEYVSVDYPVKGDEKYLFSAYFEYGGTGDSLVQPSIEFSISPTYFPRSVPPEHLLDLWDAILNSTKFVQ